MKKTTLLFTMMTIILSGIMLQAKAKTWRINNKSNYNGSTLYGENFGGSAGYPVFAQIDQAVAFAIVNNGDTLHVEGSSVIYNFSTVTKRLVIIGAGYFLTDNPKTAENALDTKLARVAFNAGSENSQLIGLNLVSAGNSFDRDIYINVDGITVKRCRIEGQIVFGFPLNDAYILQNFFSSIVAGSPLSSNGNSFFTPPTNVVFNNNICQKALTWGAPLANPTTLWPILQCNNNVFDGPDNLATPNLAFSVAEFKNNILMPTNALVNISASPGVIQYNVGTLSTQFGTADNNLVVPAITSLFITSTSTDGAYQIANSSPADNSGSDGTDRGAFGGAAVTNQYTLSGLAAIPVIYSVTTAGATSTTLPVTLQARTIK